MNTQYLRLCTMLVYSLSVRLSLIIIFTCFISTENAIAQSKKEQIATLVSKLDSLQMVFNRCAIRSDSIELVLSQVRKQHKLESEELQREIRQLQTANDEWKQRSQIAEQELRSTRQTIESLKSRIDSLILSSHAKGELLRPIKFLNHPYQSNSDCTFEGYFYSGDNILLPEPEFMENSYLDEIMPVAWNNSGVFAFYTWSTDACGFCRAYLDVYDFNGSKQVTAYSYDFESLEDEDLCAKFTQIRKDKAQVITRYSLTAMSELSMYYDRISNPEIGNMKVRAESSNGKGQVFMERNGKKTVLKEIELKKEYNDYFERWCEEDISINGYFFNPFNSNQLFVHCHRSTPCGAEGETDYHPFFVSLLID